MSEMIVANIMNCRIFFWKREELHEFVRIECEMSDAQTYCVPCTCTEITRLYWIIFCLFSNMVSYCLLLQRVYDYVSYFRNLTS